MNTFSKENLKRNLHAKESWLSVAFWPNVSRTFARDKRVRLKEDKPDENIQRDA